MQFSQLNVGDIFLYENIEYMKKNKSYSNSFSNGYKGNAICLLENNWVSFYPNIEISPTKKHVGFFSRIFMHTTNETKQHAQYKKQWLEGKNKMQLKDLDLLTPQELRTLAHEKEKAIKANKLRERTGTLKHDLYYMGADWYFNPGKCGFLMTESIKENAITEFKQAFEIVPKGTVVYSQIYDGEELWYDEDEGYIEDESNEWAEENLENIRFKSRKSK